MQNCEEKKKGSKKSLARLICFALAVILPAAILLTALFALPKVYGETFLGELADKYDLLVNTDNPKIIVVGGSSVAFGIDSPLLEEKTGYRVINFGLYATLGTKLMLDLSEANINSGDIIVLAPELDSQTLSMYFNAEAAWQGLEGNLGMLKHVGSDNYGKLLAAFPEYIGKRIGYFFDGTTISPAGIYRHDSFNEYGDISYPREYNVMTYEYDRSQTIALDESIVDPEFLAYLNDYIDRAEHAGAKVYFSFCPMNEAALAEGTTDESIYEFYEYLRDSLHCEVISSPSGSIMDKGYFYDTNYHLNDAGVRVHTLRLAEDIMNVLGSTVQIMEELPEAPGKKPADTQPGGETVTDPWEKYFTYEKFGDAMRITGVTDDAKYVTSLEIPATAEGLPVLILGKEAFKNCKALTDLTIRDNLSLIEEGAFNGCSTLTRVHMRRESAADLEAGADLFVGAPDSLKLYFYTDSSYATFISGYWWATHSARMERAQ